MAARPPPPPPSPDSCAQHPAWVPLCIRTLLGALQGRWGLQAGGALWGRVPQLRGGLTCGRGRAGLAGRPSDRDSALGSVSSPWNEGWRPSPTAPSSAWQTPSGCSVHSWGTDRRKGLRTQLGPQNWWGDWMLCSKPPRPPVLLTLSTDFREEDTYAPFRDEELRLREGMTAKAQQRQASELGFEPGPGRAAEVPGAERHTRIVRNEIHGAGGSPSKGADWQCTQRGFWEMNPRG